MSLASYQLLHSAFILVSTAKIRVSFLAAKHSADFFSRNSIFDGYGSRNSCFVQRLEVGDEGFEVLAARSVHDEEPVDNGPDAAAAAGEQFAEAQPDVADVKAVDAESA